MQKHDFGLKAFSLYTALQISAGHQSVARLKPSMTGSNFLQHIILIPNLATWLDDVSLFYNNVHILSQNPHCLSTFKSFWEDILGKIMQ